MKVSTVSMSVRSFFSIERAGEMFLKRGRLAIYNPRMDTLSYYELYWNTEKEREQYEELLARLPHRLHIREKIDIGVKIYKSKRPEQEIRPRNRSVNRRWNSYVNSQNIAYCYKDD